MDDCLIRVVFRDGKGAFRRVANPTVFLREALRRTRDVVATPRPFLGARA
jgi:hypothetical protein